MHGSDSSAVDDHLVGVTRLLLGALKVPYDETTLRRDLRQAPGYPSLGALTDALDRWRLAWDAAKMGADDLAEVQMPFLAGHTDGGFVLVTAMVPGVSVRVVVEGRGPSTVPWASFLSTWNEVVLIVEADASSSASSAEGREDAARRRGSIITRGLLLLLLVVGLLASVAGSALAPLMVSLAAVKALGLALSLLLVMTELGDNRLTRRICSMGKRASCQDILATPAARLGPIAMSDVGVVYFAGGLFAILSAPSLAPSEAATLAWGFAALSAAAFPYSVFSIAYQARLGLWCPLCVAVQVGLWIELGLGSARLCAVQAVAEMRGLEPLALGLALAALLWITMKPLVARGMRHDAIEDRALRMMRDPERVARLLDAIPPSELAPAPIEIVDGEVSAAVTITVYTDLECEICASAHQELSTLVERAMGRLAIRYRLIAVRPAEPPSARMLAVIIAAVASGESRVASHLLATWYAARREHRRLALAPLVEQTAEGAALATRHEAWTRARRYPVAPMIFVGARRLPLDLAIPDLAAFVARAAEIAGSTESERKSS